MGNNTSVLIRYSNANRYKFQWYAEFLRFIGYFVCEYLKEDNDSDELDEYIYDIEFDLDNDEKTEIYDGILREFKGNEYECNYLKNVFENYNLFQAAVTLQYFSINSTVTYMAGKHFKEAANELDILYKKYSDTNIQYEFNYARLYCRQKANLACFCVKSHYIILRMNLAVCVRNLLTSFLVRTISICCSD